ncbi:MAG: HipA family kinase [Verrucomicrobiota bacterium]
MSIRVVEIIGRSTQGITRPFLCRGDDGLQYFVKGHGAGRRALISEWIAGHLGQRLGLPIPPFAQMVIPPELIRFNARDDIHDLGAGVGFGSQLVSNVDELTYLYIEQIDSKLRARILLFDWWVCNGDRTLSPDGGNPNLLWSHSDQKLHVIDHNLAFEDSDLSGFWDEHIFQASASDWTDGFRVELGNVMKAALADMPEWWREMPEQWTEIDSGIKLSAVQKLLSRFDGNARTFWRT